MNLETAQIRKRTAGLPHTTVLFYAVYSAAWFVCAFFLYRIFHDAGYTLIWLPDGAYQHFSSFQYLCDMAESFFAGDFDFLTFGPFNYTLGQGADLFTTLNSYDLTDPVSWLCALLIPLKRMKRYTGMIYLKLWLTGISFSAYCFAAEKKDRVAVLCGALAYSFSGAVLYMAPRHPNYINWAYFLPFLFAGYELYKRKGKKFPFLSALILNIVTSYYTFYMNAVLLVVYVVVDVIAAGFESGSKETFQKSVGTAFKTAGLSILGGLLSAWILLPTVHAFLRNPRVAEQTGYTASAWHYQWKFYPGLLVSIFNPAEQPGYTSVLGLLPAAIILVPALFLLTKGNLALKINLILSSIFLCIPFFGRIMNGFGYATNRWSYAACFYFALTLTVTIPSLSALSRKKRAALTFGAFCYIAVCIWLKEVYPGPVKNGILIVLAVTAVLLAFLPETGNRICRTGLIFLILSGAIFQINNQFGTDRGNYTKEFMKWEEYDRVFMESSSRVADKSSPDDFFRVETEELTSNLSRINGINGTDVWWSLLPASLLDYLDDFELDEMDHNCRFTGLGGRAPLMELAGVRYYTEPCDRTTFVPYGYVESEDLSDDRYRVFENMLALPLGYTFTNYITKEEYDTLSALDKQEVLMQAAVLEKEQDNLGKEYELPAAISLNYKWIAKDDVTVKESVLRSKKKNASAVLETDVPEGYEIYLHLAGAKVVSPATVRIYAERKQESSGYEVTRRARLSNANYSWPVFRDGILYNLGTGGAGTNTIRLTFSSAARVELEKLEVLALPLDSFALYAGALKEHTLQNIHVDGRQITGQITVPDTRLMQLAVPSSSGWTAYVDGKETEILRSDKLYMGLLLEKGTHKIVFRYRTPLFREGFACSAATLAGATVYFALIKKIRRKRKKEG